MKIRAIYILLMSLIVSCGSESLFEDGVSPPANRPAMRSDTRCFASFSKFKAEYGAAGKNREWHHIVNQNPKNKATFGEHDLHCTDNLIAVPEDVHRQINGHYSTKPAWAGGETVRDWLAEQGFAEQYEYGMQLLKRHGYEPRE